MRIEGTKIWLTWATRRSQCWKSENGWISSMHKEVTMPAGVSSVWSSRNGEEEMVCMGWGLQLAYRKGTFCLAIWVLIKIFVKTRGGTTSKTSVGWRPEAIANYSGRVLNDQGISASGFERLQLCGWHYQNVLGQTFIYLLVWKRNKPMRWQGVTLPKSGQQHIGRINQWHITQANVPIRVMVKG